ncbi:hypothetical protein N9878_00820 [bacterium]|nr:hypothetical protein [bacterium]
MQVMSLSKEKETVMLDREQKEMLQLATGFNLGSNSKSGILALALREWFGRNPQVARMHKQLNSVGGE